MPLPKRQVGEESPETMRQSRVQVNLGGNPSVSPYHLHNNGAIPDRIHAARLEVGFRQLRVVGEHDWEGERMFLLRLVAICFFWPVRRPSHTFQAKRGERALPQIKSTDSALSMGASAFCSMLM